MDLESIIYGKELLLFHQLWQKRIYSWFPGVGIDTALGGTGKMGESKSMTAFPSMFAKLSTFILKKCLLSDFILFWKSSLLNGLWSLYGLASSRDKSKSAHFPPLYQSYSPAAQTLAAVQRRRRNPFLTPLLCHVREVHFVVRHLGKFFLGEPNLPFAPRYLCILGPVA